MSEICKGCGKPLQNIYHTKKIRKYCSPQCQADITKAQWIADWKAGLKLGYSGVSKLIAKPIRNYLFEKFNSKCSKCGWDKIHPTTGKVPLEVNHIDGDASNCIESNLELICPCCHSLTTNFKRLNKACTRFR